MKKYLFIILLLIPAKSWAASCSNTSAGNGWTCVVSISAQLGTNGGSLSGVNTSGANLLIFESADFAGNGVATTPCTPSDTVGGVPTGNTWTLIRSDTNASIERSQIWYVNSSSPAVGANHVVTCTSTGVFSSGAFAAFKTVIAPATPNINGNNTNSTTLQPGSVTPPNSNGLIISVLAVNGTSTINSVDSSFVIAESVNAAGGLQGVGLAYLTEGVSSAVNPTWTVGTAVSLAGQNAIFNQLIPNALNSQFMVIGVGK